MRDGIARGAKKLFLKLIENNKKVIVFLFFFGFLFIGLNIFNDYGVHCDEYSNQAFGKRWGSHILDVVSKGFSTYSVPIHDETSHDLIHGPAFELFLVFVEKKLLNLTDSRDVILMRHLFTFLVFYLSVFFFYLLCKFHFKSWKIGLLGSLFLILHPRIFSDSFYNSVDILFLCFYVISAYTLIRYLEKKTFPRVVFHPLTCAILVDIHVAGVILPLATFIIFATDLLRFREDKEEIRKITKTILVYALLLIAFTLLFWPLLWQNPIGNFFRALAATLKFRRQEIPPWYYNLKWIVVTTPLLYSFGFFVGFLISIKALFKDPIKFYPQNRTVLIAIFLFSVPIILPIVFKTTLYDGWRHHYFIYPIFLIFSLVGLVASFKFIKIKFHGLSYKIINTAFIFIIVSSLINTVLFMVKYHPHQYVYGNILAGKDMRRAKYQFALDYWGLSYREALEYVLKNDKNKIIKLNVANLPGSLNANIFPLNDRKRLMYVSNPDNADYILDNYGDLGEYEWLRRKYAHKKEYYSIKVGEVKFMVVYKLKE
jgi:hypothetical protein